MTLELKHRADHVWVVGSGGLLGQALQRTLGQASLYRPGKIRWDEPDAPRELRRAAAAFAARVSDRDWSVLWCAGSGIIGSSADALDRETKFLEILLDELADLPKGTLFLASSAGGLYGGTKEIPIDETSAIVPLSEYGRNKCRQEAIVAEWATCTGMSVCVGRLSNLYGPGQSLDKPQGLITQACLATLCRQPVKVFVSLDTIRDYLYVDDAAERVLGLVALASSSSPGSTTTKIVASGTPTSIAGVLGELRRVLGRSPTVLMTPSERSGGHGTVISFRSIVHPALDRLPLTTLPDGIRRVATDLQLQLAQGVLPAAASVL